MIPTISRHPARKERACDFAETFTLFIMSHMTRVLKRNPLDLWNSPKPRLDAKVMCLVVPPIDEQRLGFDVMRIVIAFPILERADDDEL